MTPMITLFHYQLKEEKIVHIEKYLSHNDKYSLTVFKSDFDMKLSLVYKSSEDRWLLEFLFA